MDTSAAGAAAWTVLGAVLGLLLAATALATVRAARGRRGRGTATGQPAPLRVDDLAEFLEHPPGTRPEPPGPAAGWTSLTPPAPPAILTTAPPAGDHTYRALALLCLAALTLVGLAGAVAAGYRESDEPRASATRATTPPSPSGRTTGELTAGGLVLQQRAVGITVTYPELSLSVERDTVALDLRLPTWNCLTATAPTDPAASGCIPSLVEHAELTTPELSVERDGNRLVLRGPATTELRPSGSAPESTGRVYEVELTVVLGAEPAGEIRIGTGSAQVTGKLGEN
ncbi:hypothetical protein [Blastococcus sp. TF02-8]|uniref:hypothetical protein n=1 Tax=Blastococcus sp. TF02-8 TaxID=2250574 RepID=UPI0011BFCAFE|nr:hypothetical protein [Blastococcus sp. TF02-8]